MLGFQVVARLATRLGIEVSLIQTAGTTGVTAIISLPPDVFEIAKQPNGVTGTRCWRRSLPPRTLPPPALAQRGPDLPAPVTGPVAITPAPVLYDAELDADLDAQPVTSSHDDAAHDAAVAAELMEMANPTPPSEPETVVARVAPAPTAGPEPAQAPAPTPAQAPAPTTAAGLTKRVRGAQLPDLGVAEVDGLTDLERPAEEVRNSLASLQRGTDLGRQRQDS